MRLWELLDTKITQVKKPLDESAKEPQNLAKIEARLIVPAKGFVKPR
jgi:hypothetical protein